MLEIGYGCLLREGGWVRFVADVVVMEVWGIDVVFSVFCKELGLWFICSLGCKIPMSIV